MNLEFKKTMQPSIEELFDLRTLFEQSFRFDHYRTKIYWETITNRKHNLYYDYICLHAGKLVGYLGVFIFEHNTVELTAVIDPNFRNQGIFNTLFKEALAEIKTWGIYTKVSFPCPQKATRALQIIKDLGNAKYLYSEFIMQLKKPSITKPQKNIKLKLQQATFTDINTLAKMDELCFNGDYTEMVERFNNTFNNSNRKTWLATINGENIGKIHVLFKPDEALIHDFCILPQHQGQKYGQTMIQSIINYLCDQQITNIRVNAISHQPHILQFYKKLTFITEEAYDYWLLDLHDSLDGCSH
jgi:N-acetylglutamate synthase-like GNAT family acetyltransferase